MRRLAGCLVVCVIASAAAWAGCRDVVEDDRRLQAGTGTDAVDARVILDVVGEPGGSGSDGGIGSGSDGGIGSGSDGGIGSGSDGGIGSGSDGGIGSGSDGGIGSGSDGGTGSGSDAGTGSGSDAGTGDVDAGIADAGLPGPPIGPPDARPIFETGELDRTSFYACAGGGSATGVSIGLPLVVIAGFAVRRRRRRIAR